MKKVFVLAVAAFLLLAWTTPAKAATEPYYNETFGSTHSVANYLGTPIPITVDRVTGIRVDANFTKGKGKCTKGAVPGLRLEGEGQRWLFTPPTDNGVVRNDYVVISWTLAPGTYTVTPFYSCVGTSSTRVLLY